MNDLFVTAINTPDVKDWIVANNLQFIITDQVVNFVGLLFGLILVYYIGRIIIINGTHHIILSTAKTRAWHKKDIEKREKTLISLLKSFWKIIILAYLAAMVAHDVFNIDLSPLFASAGIIGVALGFGSQSLIKDFLSGIFIIAENQYRVGDVVDIMGSAGTVERVGTRSTVIRDIDGNVHYIPNGTIQVVINKTMGYSVSRFILHVDPMTEIQTATKLINQVGKKLANEAKWKEKIIEPPQFIAIGEINGRSVELIVSGKTMPSDQWDVTSEMRTRLLAAFEKNGINFATPLGLINSRK